jgi:hypothetical protein
VKTEAVVEIETAGYSVEAEIGRVAIDTHKIKRGSRTVYDTRRDLFPKKSPLESYRTECLDELLLYLPCKDSYRVTGKILNRIRWEVGGNEISHRTIANVINREGAEIIEYLEEKSESILRENGFEANCSVTEKVLENYGVPKVGSISEENVIKAIEKYNEGKPKELQIELTELHESYENMETSVNISIDDVGAKKQKESGRSKYSKHKQKGTRESVKNTVIHVQKGTGRYIINGSSIFQALKFLMALLFQNKLIKAMQLVFYVDGADDLKTGINKLFGWIPYKKMILDWYHLKKKCEQRLSMGIKGTVNRNMVLEEVLSYLWIGKIDQAVSYLRELPKSIFKDYTEIERLIAYFDRNWSFIPCYAIRKALGLRISSNMGEKANHLVVADRQKHNGMSWSKKGSVSLATIATLHINEQQDNWIQNRDVGFEFVDMEKCA